MLYRCAIVINSAAGERRNAATISGPALEGGAGSVGQDLRQELLRSLGPRGGEERLRLLDLDELAPVHEHDPVSDAPGANSVTNRSCIAGAVITARAMRTARAVISASTGADRKLKLIAGGRRGSAEWAIASGTMIARVQEDIR